MGIYGKEGDGVMEQMRLPFKKKVELDLHDKMILRYHKRDPTHCYLNLKGVKDWFWRHHKVKLSKNDINNLMEDL